MVIDQLRCPVDDCDWVHIRTPPTVGPDVLANVFGRGVMQAAAHHTELHAVERVVRDHMAGHTTADFLRTITRLAARVDELELQRPVETVTASGGLL